MDVSQHSRLFVKNKKMTTLISWININLSQYATSNHFWITWTIVYVKTTDTSTGTKRGVYMAAEQSNTDLLGSIVELSKL